MARSRCRVSYADLEGVLHGIDVDAESLYEAVAIAVAQIREDDISPATPGPMTEFTVAAYRVLPARLPKLGFLWGQDAADGGAAHV